MFYKIIIIAATSCLLSSKSVGQHANNPVIDSTQFLLLKDLKNSSIYNESGKDFIIKIDSSYMEFYFNGVFKASIPLAFNRVINMDKFDSVSYHAKDISKGKKKMVIKCYLNKSNN